MLSATDHANIAAAVTAAEAKTSGEIFCIAAEEVSQYREIPLAWGAAFALILPPLLLVAGVHPWTWAVQESQGWNAVPASAQTLISEAIGLYALAQTALFAVVALFVTIPEVRRALTPGFLKRHRVRRTAYAHFASTGLINAPNRTGVLIFASLKDRQVEIVADKAIHDEVGDKVWDAAVKALVTGMKKQAPASGFVQAIEVCGAALAQHFPSEGPHDNRFPDGVVEV